jgi:HTH-type transcriptional regulator/antitoxin HigA
MAMTVSDVLAPWGAINAALGLSAPIRDQAHYTELLAFVDECFERFGADGTHPVFALVDLVATRIADYESRLHPWTANSTPASRLAFLMEQHGLRQCDLPEVGAQSVVSAVLAGKRALNLRQTQALARRFAVPMDAFA